jgi:hypothetical protein
MTMRIACAQVLLTCLAFLPAARAGDKTQFEDVIKQMLGTMDKLTKTLTTITDEDTAKSARPELRKAAGTWHLITKKAEGMPPPSKEEKDRLAKQYKPKLEEATKKLFGEVDRVKSIPGGRQALLEISGVLEKKGKQ